MIFDKSNNFNINGRVCFDNANSNDLSISETTNACQNIGSVNNSLLDETFSSKKEGKQ